MTSQKSTRETLMEFVDAVGSPEAWPAVEGLLRRATAVVADEWRKNAGGDAGLRIDVRQAVKDLANGAMNADLQQFFLNNHRFVAQLAEKNRRAAVETYDFVDEHMPHAMFNPKQMDVIASKRERIMALDGHILDLGVYKGSSTRSLARIFPERIIHGFDSFEGLPDDWSHVLKGTFGDVKGILPDMPSNVKLYKGWFDDTLPPWYEMHKDRPVSLLRVDCDIYSSTRTIFRVLGPLVRSGTCIVFDELIGYRGFKDHEYKAFSEFQAETGLQFEYISFGLTYAMGFVL
jgi:hypothetical protein